MSTSSHVISQQVFGSSKKLQFIGLSPMESLLTAIDQQEQQQLKERQQLQQSKASQQTMSIESLLDSNGDTSNKSNKRSYSAEDKTDNGNDSQGKTSRRKTMETATVVPASPSLSVVSQSHWKSSQMTTITCYHASVAQKSYGSEKRFLCPPPVVRFQSPTNTNNVKVNDNATIIPTLGNDGISHSTSCHLTMAVMNENGDIPLEQQAVLDEEDQCTFKYLHVTGSAKAKQFSLRINISSHNDNSTTYNSPSSNDTSPSLSPSSSPSPTGSPLSSPPHRHRDHQQSQSYATFLSKPISIISKPSKKTAKTRNVTTCILVKQPVSFYNRINSQTVRTKYMTSEKNHLCANNTSWSPFEIIIIRQPQQKQSSSNNTKATSPTVVPLVYGSELMLRDTRTGIRSQPLVIRKVDRGRIVPDAYGPVSQMQKVALQLVTSTTSSSSLPRCQSMYLSALGTTTTTTTTASDGNGSEGTREVTPTPVSQTTTTILDYAASRLIPEGLEVYEKVDDHLCWTIVGISTFEYSFYDNQTLTAKEPVTKKTTSEINLPLSTTLSPTRCITPFPVLTSIQYKPASHTLDIIGQHLTQTTTGADSPSLLSLWLGSHHGPLQTTIQPAPPPDQTHILVDLPSTQDLIVANHDRLISNSTSRTLELPLYFVRQDGVVYHSGKALNFELLVNSDAGRWSIVDLRQ